MSDGTGIVTDMTAHEAILRQVQDVLRDSDMTETQKQQILVALSLSLIHI